MILLALIIACLLSRKKIETQLDYGEKKNFVGGVPVIFQEELEQQQIPTQQHQQQVLPPRYSQGESTTTGSRVPASNNRQQPHLVNNRMRGLCIFF
jgi:hypothetical protein